MDQCSRILALYKSGMPIRDDSITTLWSKTRYKPSRIGIADWHPGLSFRRQCAIFPWYIAHIILILFKKLNIRDDSSKKKLKAMIGKRFTDVGEPRCPKRYLRRNCEKRQDYWASNWGKMLIDSRCRMPGDRKGGERFRRRFRVPHIPFFERLVKIVWDRQSFKEGFDCREVQLPWARARSPLF